MNSLQEAIFEAMGRQSPDNSQVASQAGLPEAQRAHETYIFACDSEGRVSDWTELPGSFQGGTDHQRAINGFLAEANSQAGSHE